MGLGASLIAKLGLDTAGFKSGLSQAKGQLSQFAGALGVGLGIGSIVAFGKSVLDMAGNIQDTADRLDMGTDALQGFQGAFEQSGASAETFDKGMTKLNQKISEARSGNKEAIESFKKMGISIADLDSNSAEEILLKIADSAHGAGNWGDKLSGIMDLMGKAGIKMAPGLRAGREEMMRLAEETSKMNAEAIKALDTFGDDLAKMGRDIKSWAGNAVSDIGLVAEFFGALSANGWDKNKALDEMAARRNAEKKKGDAANAESATIKKLEGEKRAAAAKEESWQKYREDAKKEEAKRSEDAIKANTDLEEIQAKRAFDKLSPEDQLLNITEQIRKNKEKQNGLDQLEATNIDIENEKLKEQADKIADIITKREDAANQDNNKDLEGKNDAAAKKKQKAAEDAADAAQKKADQREQMVELAQAELDAEFAKLDPMEKVASLHEDILKNKEKMKGLNDGEIAALKLKNMALNDQAIAIAVNELKKSPDQKRQERRDANKQNRLESRAERMAQSKMREDARKKALGMKPDSRNGRNRDAGFDAVKRDLDNQQKALDNALLNCIALNEIAKNTKGLAENQ